MSLRASRILIMFQPHRIYCLSKILLSDPLPSGKVLSYLNTGHESIATQVMKDNRRFNNQIQKPRNGSFEIIELKIFHVVPALYFQLSIIYDRFNFLFFENI
jgi:hypothetical protein